MAVYTFLVFRGGAPLNAKATAFEPYYRAYAEGKSDLLKNIGDPFNFTI